MITQMNSIDFQHKNDFFWKQRVRFSILLIDSIFYELLLLLPYFFCISVFYSIHFCTLLDNYRILCGFYETYHSGNDCLYDKAK